MTQPPETRPIVIRTPCGESDTPEDWFISRDGRQYSDDEYLTDQQMEAIARLVIADTGTGPGLFRRIYDAITVAEEQAKADALRRRRKAKDACFAECLFRERCLDLALSPMAPEHGTWGGYYEEELRVLRKRIARRRRADSLLDD